MIVTFRQARQQIRELGLRIKATGWDDFRVYWPEEAQDKEAGYFTPDLYDAIDTARAMKRERDENAARAARHVAGSGREEQTQ